MVRQQGVGWLGMGATLLACAVGCTQRPLVDIDGSSTVYPVTARAAELFSKQNSGVKVAVGFSGTGGGFKKFIAKEIDICDASRPISDDERAKCQAAGIEYVQFDVAIDGLAVMVNPQNDWIDCLSVAQLKQIWDEGSAVEKWSDVDPNWPAEPIKLYGPGTDSGTFDYFTEVVNGKAKRCRSTFSASEDDNVLVVGVAGDKYSLGYFGYAYYVENKEKVKLLSIDGGTGECIAPTDETVLGGTYAPLARPIFIYVNKASLARPEVASFVKFYLENVQEVAAKVGYVQVTDETKAANLAKLQAALGN